METILRKYMFYCNDMQFGQIVKLALRYANGETIDYEHIPDDVRGLFLQYVKKDIDKMLNERKRAKENKERGAKNANKK